MAFPAFTSPTSLSSSRLPFRVRSSATSSVPPPALASPNKATPRCSSLEESKKRARSPYDNIPDLNQLYLRELSRITRAPLSPDAIKPILRPDGVLSPSSPRRWRRVAAPDVPDALPSEADKEAARAASLAAYRKLRFTLLGDTAFVGALVVCAGWAIGDVNTARSVALGCAGSMAYVFLLARGVDRLGSTGDALAPARAAVLALLVVYSAKHRDVLQVLPVMLGFFSYKVATLLPLLTGEGFESESL